MTHLKRRHVVAALGMAALCLSTGAAVAQKLDTVRIGVNGVISDAPFFLAETKGFFAEQNIKAEFIPFDAGPQMIAPLGTGQLDVAGGASSAGLFNAAARGIDIRIVADRGSTPPGYEYVPILVRKELVDSGKVKNFGDLKGLKVAEAGQGGSQSSMLNEAMKRHGLSYNDVEHVFLGYPQHVAALSSGAVDASVTTEPSATQAVQGGYAVRMTDDKIYPNQQVAVLLYGGDFVKKRADVGRRFMIAYLKGARVYNGALKDGHLAGPAADEVIKVLVAKARIKDAELYKALTPSGINPNGEINRESLEKDLKFYGDNRFLEGKVELDKVLEPSFVQEALKVVGPYEARK